jgi:hypothetical protein
VSFRDVRGSLEERNFFHPAGIQTPERPVRSLVTIPTTEQLICNLERILFKMDEHCGTHGHDK